MTTTTAVAISDKAHASLFFGENTSLVYDVVWHGREFMKVQTEAFFFSLFMVQFYGEKNYPLRTEQQSSSNSSMFSKIKHNENK